MNPALETVEPIFTNAWGNRLHMVVRWTNQTTGARASRGTIFDVTMGGEKFHLATPSSNEHHHGVQGPGLALFTCCSTSPRDAAAARYRDGHRPECRRARPRTLLPLQDERAQAFIEGILNVDPLASALVAREVLHLLETFLREEWSPTRFDPGTRRKVIHLGTPEHKEAAVSRNGNVSTGSPTP